MRLFSEKVNPTFTSSPLNILTVKDFTEIFYDVYEVEINGKKFIAEKVSDHKGAPVVVIPVIVNGKQYNTPFLLEKGKFSVHLNKNNLGKDIPINVSQTQQPELVPVVEKIEHIGRQDEMLFDTQQGLLDDIDKAKKSAIKIVEGKAAELVKASEIINEKINAAKIEILTEFHSNIDKLEENTSRATNKALSRIGNVKTQLEDTIKDISSKLNEHYENRLSLVEEKIEDISSDARAYIIKTIKENKDTLIQDIGLLISEENKGGNLVNLKGIKDQVEKLIGTRFNNEMASLKRLIELSSGGGSVAQQFAAGGTMRGDLTVVGTISAAHYLGIPSGGGGVSGDYLPLSGGTVTGSVTVTDSFSAREYLGLPESSNTICGLQDVDCDTSANIDLSKTFNTTVLVQKDPDYPENGWQKATIFASPAPSTICELTDVNCTLPLTGVDLTEKSAVVLVQVDPEDPESGWRKATISAPPDWPLYDFLSKSGGSMYGDLTLLDSSDLYTNGNVYFQDPYTSNYVYFYGPERVIWKDVYTSRYYPDLNEWVYELYGDVSFTELFDLVIYSSDLVETYESRFNSISALLLPIYNENTYWFTPGGYAINNSLTGIVLSNFDEIQGLISQIAQVQNNTLAINSALTAQSEYTNSNFLHLTGGTLSGSLTVLDTISSTNVIYASGGNSNQWNEAYTLVQNITGDTTLTATVTSDIAAGAIQPAQVIPAGTTFQEFVETLLFKTYYPTYSVPSASLSVTNIGSTVEAGTSGVNLSITYNRGSIIGKTVGGVWQPTTFQNYRAGTATNYNISGVNLGSLTSSKEFPSYIIKDNTNTFYASVSYSTGPQPLDSKNNNFETPLPAGSINNFSTTVTGKRKAFYGSDFLDVAPSTSAEVRSLSGGSVLGPVNGTVFTINIPVSASRVVFAYPDSLRDVTSVQYVEGNQPVADTFELSTVSVSGANGYTPINYKVYTYIPLKKFNLAVTYIVTI